MKHVFFAHNKSFSLLLWLVWRDTAVESTHFLLGPFVGFSGVTISVLTSSSKPSLRHGSGSQWNQEGGGGIVDRRRATSCKFVFCNCCLLHSCDHRRRPWLASSLVLELCLRRTFTTACTSFLIPRCSSNSSSCSAVRCWRRGPAVQHSKKRTGWVLHWNADLKPTDCTQT